MHRGVIRGEECRDTYLNVTHKTGCYRVSETYYLCDCERITVRSAHTQYW